MIDRDISAWVQSLGIGFTAVNTFVGILPDTPDICCTVIGTPGRSPRETHDGGRIDLGRVAVWVRHPTYATAQSALWSVYEAACAFANSPAGDNDYLALVPLQPPFLLQRDASNRVVMAMNVEATRKVA